MNVETQPKTRVIARLPRLRFWLVSLAVAVFLFALGLSELMIRRQSAVNLYLINKSLASTALMMIAASYTLSALCRINKGWKSVLVYRRYFGLVGYGFAVAHIAAFFVVQDPQQPGTLKFPFPAYLIEYGFAFACAVAGFAVFTYAFYLSIGSDRFTGTASKTRLWRRRLRYGYVGVVLVFAHSFLLKYEGWITWVSTLTPRLPPLSLIVSAVVIGMIAFKATQLVREGRFF